MLLSARIALGRFGDWLSKTLIGELLIYLKTRYFTLQFGNYEHLPVTEDARKNLEWFLFALFLGVVVAVAAYLRHRAVSSRLLSALQSHEATSADSAKTLSELGLEKKGAIRRLLARPTPVSRAVFAAKEDEKEAPQAEEVPQTEAPSDAPTEAPGKELPAEAPPAKEETDALPVLTLDAKTLSSARLFIEAETLESLAARYRQKGHPALVMAATVLLSTIVLALVMRFLPFVLGIVDAIL